MLLPMQRMRRANYGEQPERLHEREAAAAATRNTP
jgi:hypothetical protein